MAARMDERWHIMTDPVRNTGETLPSADEIADRAEDLAAGTRDAAAGASEAVGDARDAAADLHDAASEGLDAFSTQAKEAMAKAKEAADEGTAYVKAKYQENPGLVIAVGAAAVVGVAAVLKALFRR